MRQFTEDDVDNLFGLNSDPQVMRYLTGGRPAPREEIRDQVISFRLAVYDRSAWNKGPDGDHFAGNRRSPG